MALFAYLFANAAFEDTTFELGPREIHLKRGQVVVSIRRLSEAMGLHKSKIERVLQVFKNRDMIETRTETHGTIITICKYDQFQEGPQSTETPLISKPRHDRDTVETLNKKKKNLRKKESIDSESLQPTCRPEADVPEMDFDFWWSCWRIKGAKRGSKDRARKLYDAAIKARGITHQELCVHVERVQRFYETSATPTSKQLHPATWLYQKRWNDELVIDQPERNPYAASSAEQLAREFAKEHGGFGGTNGDAQQANLIGQDNAEHANGQEQPRPSNQDHGGGLPEVPSWFDQEND